MAARAAAGDTGGPQRPLDPHRREQQIRFRPTLGSDEIFQFTFDAKTGQLASNTPAVFLMKPALGPRHFITSSDNKFVYVLSEFTGTVTTFSLEQRYRVVDRSELGIRLAA